MNVIFIEGSCVGFASLVEWSVLGCLQFLDMTQEELEAAQQYRDDGGDDATYVVAILVLNDVVVKVTNSDGEDKFFIGPYNSFIGDVIVSSGESA